MHPAESTNAGIGSTSGRSALAAGVRTVDSELTDHATCNGSKSMRYFDWLHRQVNKASQSLVNIQLFAILLIVCTIC